MKLALALETSTRRPSIALGLGSKTVALELSPARAHGSDLLPAIDQLFRAGGFEPGSLAAIVVGTGPGSFTGLRVGIATALGLARATGAELFGLPSIEAWVYGELAAGATATVLLDARGGGFYRACYRRLTDEVETLTAPAVVGRDEALALLRASERVLAEPGLADALELSEIERARCASERPPRAEQLLELGRARLARSGAMKAAQIEPLYLRPFAATARKR